MPVMSSRLHFFASGLSTPSRSIPTRFWTLAVSVLLSFAAASDNAPEPEGYWTGPIEAPVPATIRGGKVIHADALSAMLDSEHPLIIDVSNTPKRPEGMAADAPWIPVAHDAVPGSLWIPDVGLGSISANMDEFFLAQLTDETGEDYDYPIVIYCHEQCWLSWNAAKRAINHGFRNVHWFPEGIEGWKAAGFETQIAEPRLPPELSQRNP
jgi:PQQ-dependent catabolism-associated CXXCW motif protein